MRSMWKLRERKMSTPTLQSPGGVSTLPNELKRRATDSMVSIDYDSGVEAKKPRGESMTSGQSGSTANTEEGAIEEDQDSEEEEEELEEGFVAALASTSQPHYTSMQVDQQPLTSNNAPSIISSPTAKLHSSPNPISEKPSFDQQLHTAISNSSGISDFASKPPLSRAAPSSTLSFAPVVASSSTVGSESTAIPSQSNSYLEQVARKTSQLKKVEPNYIPPPPASMRGSTSTSMLGSKATAAGYESDDPESPIEDFASVRYNAIQEKKASFAAPKSREPSTNEFLVPATGSPRARTPAASAANSKASSISSPVAQDRQSAADQPMNTPEGSPTKSATAETSASAERRKRKNSLAFLLN